MSIRLTACLILLCCLPPVSAQKLKHAFAAHSLKALRMIEKETQGYQLAPPDSALVPSSVGAALADLGTKAQADNEKAVVAVLHTVLDAKLSHNTTMSTLSHLATAALWDCAACSRGPSQMAAVVAGSPTTLAIHSKESACFQALESVLHSRNYHAVPECSKDTLEVPTPARLVVSKN
jgi:hypothetical protein